MKIETAHNLDINQIYELYDMATAYQKSVFEKQWEGFELSLIKKEIEENRLWKMSICRQIVCVISINFNDQLFWGRRDSEPSIYIHRIELKDNFRGQSVMTRIIERAKKYANFVNFIIF